ncbi:hypothetical protein [Candidatus Binatus sp.]|uniref:hypothetical protein n=1 Tax=Candidatus Binatus sp. TaxID=2811406 RepID=UPI003C737222
MGNLIDLTGQRFGRLVVLRRDGSDAKGGALWVCCCDCGTETTVRGYHLRSGHSKSCGCFNRELLTTHGLRHTGLYRSWQNLRRRCRDAKYCHYSAYGGRGITFDPRWGKFENFFADMGATYFEHAHLHRKNVDGNYEKSNVVWLSPEEHRAAHAAMRSTAKSSATLTLKLAAA